MNEGAKHTASAISNGVDVSGNSTGAKGKVLYVITKATWGGAQRYVYDLATRARAAGYAPVVAAGTPGELAERLSVAGIRVIAIPGLARDVRLFSDLQALFGLAGILRRERPAVVHVNSSKAGIAAALAFFLSGYRGRSVFTVHGWAYNEDRNIIAKAGIALLYWLIMFDFSTVICVSEGTRRQARWMPFAGRRMVVVRNGIAPVSLYSREYARMTLMPSRKSSVWIGTLAELHPIKGLDVLLTAFAALAKEFPETFLALFGEGQERARLETLAAELGLTERVRFFGHLKDGASYLSAFDIFVQPSHSEALAYAVIEAGHAKLPVVATKVGGIPEIVKDGETGLLVPPGDALQLQAALVRLLRNEDMRARLGNALHARVVQDFDAERMAEETFALYR